MRISQITVIGMFALFLIFAVYGWITFDLSLQEMKKFLATRNEGFSFNMMQELDLAIHDRLADFQIIPKFQEVQTALKFSNAQEELTNLQADIGMGLILDSDNSTQTPFIQKLAEEELSKELQDIIRFYKDEYDYDVVEELFITNAYGKNIALAIGTSNETHSDDEWWQITKTDGLFVGDMKYYENYASHGKAFGFRITDEEGNFIGVMRMVLTLDDMLREFIPQAELVTNSGRNVILLNGKGQILYSNGIQNVTNSSPVPYFNKILNSKDVGYFELEGFDEDIQLLSFAKSTGYRTFEGFDWTVVVEQNSSSIVDEFLELRNSILLVSIIGMVSAVIIGIIISFVITNPLKEFSKLSRKIAKGDFDIHVKKSKINEINDIAKSFETMSASLKTLIETETKLAEANAKVKNERLSAIGEVASSMAHNMKNPLATIRSSVDIVKRESQNINPEIELVLKRMDRAMNTLSHQLQDVLNYVRTTPLETKKTEISSLLKSAVESIEIPQNITVEIPQNSVKIKCDQEKIEIVFINIILNAIQALENTQGKITIRIKEEHNQVLIEFEDTGKGIPENLISKIFDPLVTTKEKGTGLGLSSSKSIIEQHGGTISVKNDPTTFTIALPKG